VWTLKRAVEGAIRQGYPWVFSNQLAHSPKEAEAGEPIELRDFAGRWVARGYGHPHSLISFRALSLDERETDAGMPGFFLRKLLSASALRLRLGMGGYSHRLCFAEADGLPGLIVDRYRLAGSPASQVLVVESTTAGMDRCLPEVLEGIQLLVNQESAQDAALPTWSMTGVLVDQAGAIRQLEELVLLPKTWHKPLPLEDVTILTAPLSARLSATGAGGEPGLGGEPLAFRADLLGGQKTGFFLDQSFNLDLAERLLLGALAGRPPRRVRVLDLFCYAGQWSARLSAALGTAGIPCEVVAVDASQKALDLAKQNISAHGGEVKTVRLDIVEHLSSLEEGAFDVVICDPPALVKRRKELPKSVRAYQKVNREALRRVAPGGLIFTCSCSGLLDEESFREMLGYAAYQAQRNVRWVARGGQGPDHPITAVFPEGRYLKCWAGVVD
jgi:23S rRNA (cytosine1962-C5)-methyltransferase